MAGHECTSLAKPLLHCAQGIRDCLNVERPASSWRGHPSTNFLLLQDVGSAGNSLIIFVPPCRCIEASADNYDSRIFEPIFCRCQSEPLLILMWDIALSRAHKTRLPNWPPDSPDFEHVRCVGGSQKRVNKSQDDSNYSRFPIIRVQRRCSHSCTWFITVSEDGSIDIGSDKKKWGQHHKPAV